MSTGKVKGTRFLPYGNMTGTVRVSVVGPAESPRPGLSFPIGLAVVLVLLGFVFLVPSAVAVQDYFETFEDDSPPNPPAGDFYTFETEGSGVFRTTSTETLGQRSYVQIDSTATGLTVGMFNMEAKDVDLCDGGSVSFAFRFKTLPTGAGNTWQFGIIESTPSAGTPGLAVFQVTDAGVIKGLFDGDGTGATSTQFTTTIVVDTWYNATIFANCPFGIGTFYLVNQDESVTADDDTAGVGLDNFVVYGIVEGQMRLDNMAFLGVNDPPPPPVTGSAVTDAFPPGETLVGWDVDPNPNGALIARMNDGTGQKVRVWAAGPLGAPIDFDDIPDCASARTDGVSAYAQKVAYIDCDVSQATQVILLRNHNDLDTFTHGGPECEPEGCPDNFGDEDLGDFEDYRIIENVELYPIDLSKNFDNTHGGNPGSCSAGLQPTCDYSFLSLVVGTQTGKVGVISKVFKEGADDGASQDFVQFASTTPEEVCSWVQPSTGKLAVGAADSAESVAMHSVVYSETHSGAVGATGLSADISNSWTNPNLNGGIGLSCGGEYAIVQFGAAGDKVRVVGASNGLQVYPASGEVTITDSGRDRLVAMAPDEDSFAYVDGSTIKVFNWTAPGPTPPAVCSISVPSGTWVGMQFDGLSQNLFVATDTSVTRFDMTDPETCDLPEESTPGSTTTPTPTSTTGIFPSNAMVIGEHLGGGEFGGKMFLGGLLMFGVGGAGYFGTDKTKLGLLVGVFVGFLFAWGFGLFSHLVAFVIVVLACLVLGTRWFLRG